jgi:hypothetical protein
MRYYVAMKEVLILALLLSGLVLCCEGIKTLSNIQRMTATMEDSQRHAQAATLVTLNNIQLTMTQVRQAVTTFNSTTMPRINETLADVNQTVKIINTQTLPQLAADSHTVLSTTNGLLENTDKNLTALANETNKSLQDTEQLVAETIKTEQDAQTLLADPVMMKNLKDASANLSKSTEPLPDIVQNFDTQEKALTHIVKFYENKLTAPVSLTKTVASTVVNLGVKFGGAFLGAFAGVH